MSKKYPRESKYLPVRILFEEISLLVNCYVGIERKEIELRNKGEKGGVGEKIY